MGLGLLVSSCSCDCPPPQRVEVEVEVKQSKTQRTPTKDYKVLDVIQGTHFVALLVRYSAATNYEGKKILVYRDSLHAVLAHGEKFGLDPHFCESEHPSPIARFEPTTNGWANAIRFMKVAG